ncbi:hypothetical protein K439DRAFT_1657509 [Ramaria rubella]|nr:hypothetical protein K439DRAFT_1657509 [Ramaria rubella]
MSALDTLLKEIRSSFEQLYATRYTQGNTQLLFLTPNINFAQHPRWVSFSGIISLHYLLRLNYSGCLPFFNSEINPNQTGKWSYPRLLFFLNRYLVIFWQVFNTRGAFNPTNTAKLSVIYHPPVYADSHLSLPCTSAKIAVGDNSITAPSALISIFLIGEAWGHVILEVAGTCTIWIVHLIMCFRIYGLYGRSPRLIYGLSTLLVITGAAEVYVDVSLTPNFQQLFIGKGGFVCVPGNSSKTSNFMIPVLIFEAVLFLLAVYKVFDQWQFSRAGGLPFNGSTLLHIMIRDSVAYFFIILLVYVINAVIWHSSPPTLRFLLQGYTISAISILGTRMLINIRLEGIRTLMDDSMLIPSLELSYFAARSFSGTGSAGTRSDQTYDTRR